MEAHAVIPSREFRAENAGTTTEVAGREVAGRKDTAMDVCLLVVARTQPELWQELVLRHAADPRVEVILDRRVGPPPAAGNSPNRRASGIEMALDADGFAVILR